MLLLLPKFLLAPLLVAVGSAAQRRWGQTVGGLVIGLPLTSLPLLAILVLAQGPGFAARAAVASLAGVAGQAVLTFTYARVAGRHSPVIALLAGVASFAVTAAALAPFSPNPLVAAVLATVSLAVLLRWWPTGLEGATTRPRPDGAVRSTTGLRMVLAGAFSLLVSQLASPLGPHLAGLVTALPVLSVVMFALTHHDEGAGAVRELAHGVQRGSFSVVTALVVLALALPTGHVVLAFGSAIAASVLTQVVAGLAQRHPEPARADGTLSQTEVAARED